MLVGERKKNNETKLKINLVNVISLKYPEKLKRIGTLIKCWDSDVTVLVDTRVGEEIASKLNRNGRKTFSTNNESRGVILSVREALEPKLISTDELDSNYLAITINIQGLTVSIVGVYSPNDQSTKFYWELLPNMLAELSTISDEIIIAGDLNLNLSKSVGYTQKKPNKLKSWELTR